MLKVIYILNILNIILVYLLYCELNVSENKIFFIDDN